MPFPNEHAARQIEPGKFTRIRRKNDHFGKGTHVIFGINQAGKTEVQSIRFDSLIFTPAQARKWLQDHSFKSNLEMASGAHKMSELNGVEIAAVGKFRDMTGREIEITDQDLQDMEQNFNDLNEYIKPPLKLGHTENQSLNQLDGQPALGWPTRVYVQGSKLFSDLVDVPTHLKEAINQRRWRRVSAEIYPSVNSIGGLPSEMNIKGKVLKAISLLGADIPAIKNLSDLPILASEDEEGLITIYRELNMNQEKEVMDMDAQIVKLSEENEQLKAEISTFKKEKEGSILLSEDTWQQTRKEIESLQKKAETGEKAALKLREMEVDTKLQKYQDAGRLNAGSRKEWKDKIMNSKIEETDAFQLIEMIPEGSVPFGTIGHSSDIAVPNAIDLFEAKISEKRTANPGLDEVALLSEVCQENPELASQVG